MGDASHISRTADILPVQTRDYVGRAPLRGQAIVPGLSPTAIRLLASALQCWLFPTSAPERVGTVS